MLFVTDIGKEQFISTHQIGAYDSSKKISTLFMLFFTKASHSEFNYRLIADNYKRVGLFNEIKQQKATYKSSRLRMNSHSTFPFCFKY